MTEAIAYKWAAQVMRGLEGRVEPHLLQTLADRIVAAILAATVEQRKEDAEKADGFCDER